MRQWGNEVKWMCREDICRSAGDAVMHHCYSFTNVMLNCIDASVVFHGRMDGRMDGLVRSEFSAVSNVTPMRMASMYDDG